MMGRYRRRRGGRFEWAGLDQISRIETLNLIQLPVPLLQRFQLPAPSQPDLVWSLVPFQTEPALYHSPLFHFGRLTALELCHEVGRECLPHRLSGLLFDPHRLSLRAEWVGVDRCPADVQDFIMVEGLVGHGFLGKL